MIPSSLPRTDQSQAGLLFAERFWSSGGMRIFPQIVFVALSDKSKKMFVTGIAYVWAMRLHGKTLTESCGRKSFSKQQSRNSSWCERTCLKFSIFFAFVFCVLSLFCTFPGSPWERSWRNLPIRWLSARLYSTAACSPCRTMWFDGEGFSPGCYFVHGAHCVYERA